MKWADSLQRRFVVAYMSFALGSCLLLGIIAAIAVEGIEQRLVDDRLMKIASWASMRHATKLPVEMPDDVSFYHGESIPHSMRGLSAGVHEKNIDGMGLHILSGTDAAGEYVVVDHASDYDEIEFVVYSMVGAGFLIFLTMSLILGKYVARRFVTPLDTLATAVSNKNAQSELPFLESRDEMGVLARAFAAHTAELRQFLGRERFFTGDVSHELRTPLTIIIGAAEILMSQTAQSSPLHAHSERILRAATEAADCITVLLLLARTPDLIDSAEISISDVVRAEVERSRPLVSEKPVALECKINAEFSVFARRELLGTAVGNLIRNACQYTDKGSVVVRLSPYTVAVEDTGRGLPEAIRARLLDQPHSSIHVGSAGSGLGLSLVKRISEHLGATLDVTQRINGGTSISIHFPQSLTKS